jgi:hypothetical protein
MTRLAAALWPSLGSWSGAAVATLSASACRLSNAERRRCWASMARYFFHLTNGDGVADEVGEEFDRVEAAQRHAMAMARELSGSRRPDAPARHHISVVDERGVEVFKVPV